MKSPVKKNTIFALVVILILILGAGFVSYRILTNQSEQQRSLDHTHQMFHQLESIQSDLIKAETALYNFVNSGNNAHLIEFQDKTGAIKQTVAEIRILIAGIETQRRQSESFELLLEQKLSVMHAIGEIAKNESNEQSTKTALLKSQSEQLTNCVQVQVNLLKSLELNHLEITSENAKNDFKQAITAIFIVGTALSIIILGLVISSLRKEIKSQVAATEARRILRFEKKTLACFPLLSAETFADRRQQLIYYGESASLNSSAFSPANKTISSSFG